MQVQKKHLTDTTVQLTIVADQAQLGASKQQALEHLSKSQVKLQGFRKGKAPLALIEKQLDPNLLQTEFLEEAVNALYVAAAMKEDLRPVAQPKFEIKKFVPFTTLEVTVEVEAVGAIKLPDYKAVKIAKKKPTITAKDVDAVLTDLTQRSAAKKEVTRATKLGDEVVLDFTGTDAKTNEPIQGADGKGYPLVLGSNSFIPGFEDELIGLKPGANKTFLITFPKDYSVAALQSRKVNFAVTVHKVQAVTVPKLDDAFAATVGPFKTVAELKADIKQQLLVEKQNQADRDYENELITTIAGQATVAIPQVLIDEELDRLERDERQNLTYRGQTWQEHLDAEGVTEEEHRQRNAEPATLRVKAGLVLSAIAEKEKISVSNEEQDLRIQLLKGQYSDPQMQAELDKPANRRDIASRIMTEKTLAKLVGYSS